MLQFIAVGSRRFGYLSDLLLPLTRIPGQLARKIARFFETTAGRLLEIRRMRLNLQKGRLVLGFG
jgi:hypothetical protein